MPDPFQSILYIEFESRGKPVNERNLGNNTRYAVCLCGSYKSVTAAKRCPPEGNFSGINIIKAFNM